MKNVILQSLKKLPLQDGLPIFLLAIMVCLLVTFPGQPPASAHAAEGAWHRGQFSSARLLSAVDATGDLDVLPLAIEVQLAPGWKAYWRSPGDAGLPPELDWAGSDNVKRADILWPAPRRYTILGLQTFGYEGGFLLPIDMYPNEPGKNLALNLHLVMMICHDICVPAEHDLTLNLPPGRAKPSPQANLINQWRAKVPGDGRDSGIKVLQFSQAGGGKNALHLTLQADPGFTTPPDVFVEVASGVPFAPPEIRLSNGGTYADITLPMAGNLLEGESFDQSILMSKPVTLTITSGQRSMEYTAIPSTDAVSSSTSINTSASISTATTSPAPTPQAKKTAAKTNLLTMILVALAGGLILNLMPCVLPVLSLKLLSAISHEQAPLTRIRAGFLAAATGIITSFMIIALALLAMKNAGAAIGWGIQFQQPLFLSLMAVIVSLFACNMWGLFEIPLPRFIAERAGRSDDHGEHEATLAGHFATGLLATALATPCTAPFVGTAVGFALAGNTVEMLSIFLAMGVGLALPYLLVAARPSLAHKLPKPGKWMLHIKALLGLALLGTAGWLLWVLAAQVGTMPATLSVVLIGLGIAATAWHKTRPSKTSPAIIGGIMLGAVVIPLVLHSPAPQQATHDARWVEFTPEKIPAHIKNGKVVFVDITADWCLTCKANKKLALSNDTVQKMLSADDVIAMQGDWTTWDAQIGDYLAKHKRFGIPFNMVYGPAMPNGMVLPELLSSDDVINALNMARNGPPTESGTPDACASC